MKLQKEFLSENTYIAPGAVVLGEVHMGEDSSVWFNAVVRADEQVIKIGSCTNIQDNCVVHQDPWNCVEIGDYVTVGHGAIIHGCKIGNNTLIGMGAIVMNNAIIGENCIVGAGALVTESTVIPDNSLVIGSPAKVVRPVRPEEVEHIHLNATYYAQEARRYREES